MAIPVPQWMAPAGYGDRGQQAMQNALAMQQMEMDPMYQSMNANSSAIEDYLKDPKSYSDEKYVSEIAPAIHALGLNKENIANRVGDDANALEKFGAFTAGAVDMIAMGLIPDKWYSSRRTQDAKNYGQWLGVAASIYLFKYGMIGGGARVKALTAASKGKGLGAMIKGIMPGAKQTKAFTSQVKGHLNKSVIGQKIVSGSSKTLSAISKGTETMLRSPAMKYTMPGMMYRGGQRVAGQISRLANKGVGWAQKAQPYLTKGIAGESGNLARRAAAKAAAGQVDDAMVLMKEAVQTGGVDVVAKATRGLKGVQKTMVQDLLRGATKADKTNARNIITKIMKYKSATKREIALMESWVKKLPKMIQDGKSAKAIANASKLSKPKKIALETLLSNSTSRAEILKNIGSAAKDIGWKDYVSGLQGPGGWIGTGAAAGWIGKEAFQDRGPETNPFHKNYGQ